jgi:RND family efflux transporter MFP subunit
VSVKTMKPETIRQVVKLNGDVASQSEVNVYPEATSGRVVRVLRRVGTKLNRGDVIAVIDPSRAGASFVENSVYSPVTGTITSLPVTVGTTISSSTVIATLGSLDNLKITIYVAEKYSAYLKYNLPAFVSFAAAPGEEFEALVTELSPVVDSQKRTIETTLTLRERDPRIKAGMFAAVRLVIREAGGTLVIPRQALKDYNGGDVVYVAADNGTARRVPVTVGLTNDAEVEILSGIKAGDRVITAGAITDGSAIRVSDTAAGTGGADQIGGN